MTLKTSFIARESIHMFRIITNIFMLAIFLASAFNAISANGPALVKASAINITLPGHGVIDYVLNGDLISNGGIMPKSLSMRCAGKKFNVGQGDCIAGQWVDIEVTISADYTALHLSDMGNLGISPFEEKRRARCTAKNSSIMDCIWEGNIDKNLTFLPSQSVPSIERQSFSLHVEPTDNGSSDPLLINISGDLIYQPSNYAVYRLGYTLDVPASIGFDVKYNILQSSFGTQTGPVTGGLPGDLWLGGDMPTTVSLYPEWLYASFSKTEHSITSVSKQFTGPGNNELLAEIYLDYGSGHCMQKSTGSICGQLLDNANVSVSCGDRNITITTNICNTGDGQCSGDETWKIAEIYGTWGRVNIDTMCAITVLLPYE
ncbi:hypothetical protein BH012_03850 [Salmonella enterica]|nr:hypothetical protein [Salmonella enterica]ECI5352283.1 hypothetical protein [Salmonella enterica subsp. enterica]EDU6361337.1 hypothetical protein [Salmonella enterica subsp. enterica serovar Florian]EAX6600465.1 hypothetical protein [Salmonella enterica]EEJ8587958.1 hypothetical protein [Salmonella enterica subsp. enterica]